MTYPDVGATRTTLPAGYGHTHRRTFIGAGPATYERAAHALLSWQMHRRAGLAVATDGPATENRTVLLGLGRPLALVVPCRVVYVVDEPSRRGFAYGTLPGHPEEGEESFVVVSDAQAAVWLEITAFSRPGTPLARYAEPLGRAVRMRITDRYERALVELSSGS